MSTLDSKLGVVPFLKWAGGKRWFISKFRHLFPTRFERYIEPFLGSGAAYFDILPQSAILSDLNLDLMNLYNVIRDDYKYLERILKQHSHLHCTQYYYEIRDKKFRSNAKKAAQFLYLNRTCWNGLYRVNKNGEFNVPIGTKESVILD